MRLIHKFNLAHNFASYLNKTTDTITALFYFYEQPSNVLLCLQITNRRAIFVLLKVILACKIDWQKEFGTGSDIHW